MALDFSGSDAAVAGGAVQIVVSDSHPLISLARALNWVVLIELVSYDLKRTTAKGNWKVGRKLQVRVHLAVYLLQIHYNLTDRKVEYGVRDNVPYQLFCGLNIVPNWLAPDHTNIEKFRNRLSPETQCAIANELAKFAVVQGLADPSETDFDSTVQEANIAYPADANLMTKLAGLGKKVIAYVGEKARNLLPKGLWVDMKAIKEIARKYFFMPKKTIIEKKREVFTTLLRTVKKQMRPVVEFCEKISAKKLTALPWNIRRAINQIKIDAWRYLLDVGYFTRTNTIKKGKILSLFAKAVAYVDKKKVGKSAQFGRVFQLGRIKGNFFCACVNFGVDERQALIETIARGTSKIVWQRCTAFGGNRQRLLEWERQKIYQRDYGCARKWASASGQHQKQEGPSKSGNSRTTQGPPSWDRTINRSRKTGGQLARSRMKSDTATLAAGYASVLGFNMRQMMRKQGQMMKKAA